MSKKSIIYVNFSPYENVGNILTYLQENYDIVFLYSLNFHKLGKNANLSQIQVFSKGKLKETIRLFQIPTPAQLVYLLLPIRSIFLLIQIIWFTYLQNRRFGTINYYFTVNAFTGWIGILLQKLHLVQKTIFWVWDYYPPMHEDKIIALMRWIYWQFDKAASLSNRVVYLNEKLHLLRFEIGIIEETQEKLIVPIGTESIPKIQKKEQSFLKLGFIGVLKKSQGLDFIFDNEKQIIKNFPNVELEIIGAGPDEDYYKKRAAQSKINITFHGLLSEQDPKQAAIIKTILSKCHIGIAPYKPEASNASYYGDPSKVKKYLTLGLPVITTDVFHFSKELGESKAGYIMDYYKPQSLIQGTREIMANYTRYQKNVQALASKYFYPNVYPKLFED